MNQLPETPHQPTTNKTVPAWALYLTIGVAVVLIACSGIVGATGQPEPEVITKTKTVEKKVQDDSQQEKIVELEDELATANRKIETCQTAVLSSTQGFIDMLGAYVQLSTAASQFSSSGVEQATAMIDDIDAAGIGSQARACDETIGDQITGIPE